MKNWQVKIVLLLILGFVVATTTAHALTIPDLLEKIKENQGQVKTLQADMTTTIQSSNKSVPAMKQAGHLITKYPDKSKMEMTSPMKQTTITNGKKIKIIDGTTGKSFVQDLSKSPGSNPHSSLPMAPSSPTDPTKALEQFDLKIASESDSEITLEGTPKEKNEFLSKMRFTIARDNYLPTKIEVFGQQGKKLSESTIVYDKIAGVYVPIENKSTVTLPQGQMQVNVVFSNVKVNEKVADQMFGVE